MRFLKLVTFCCVLAVAGHAYGQFQGGWDVPHGQIVGGGYYGGSAYGFGYYGGRWAGGYGHRGYGRHRHRRISAYDRVFYRPNAPSPYGGYQPSVYSSGPRGFAE